jgi:iron(III) transport system permease protein
VVTISRPLARTRLVAPRNLLGWAILACITLMVVYPVALIVLGSFQTGQIGRATEFSLSAWRTAFADPTILGAVVNTLTLTFVRLAISFPLAILLAWILARTDIPGSRWFEFMFWLAFFLPPLPVTLGWIVLLDGQFGLVNQLFAPLVGATSIVNIYSFGGLVWAYLATGGIAAKVMLLTPAFRNMDASLEEASRVSGASALGTLVRVVTPIMTPALFVVLLLATIHALQAFELEVILGTPIRFSIFSTKVYALLREPPNFAAASALSTVMLVMLIPLIVLQRRVTQRGSYATVSGRFSGRKLRLRRWRLPAFLFVLLTVLTISVVPVTFLVLGTFMRLFGYFTIPQPWTPDHWARVVGDPVFLTSLRNTLVLAVGAATGSVVVCTLIAYFVMRTRFAARGVLDFASWLPFTVPGIILGVGLLWLSLGSPLLRPLYGTMALLIIATVIAGMTVAVQIIKSTFAQIGLELEEASRASGASTLATFRYVLLPVITPTLLVVAAFSFIAAARNISTVALLATSSVRPLSLLQLDYMVDGRYESAAVTGVIVAGATVGVALLARVLGSRGGLPS